jgi:hypothetical protein
VHFDLFLQGDNGFSDTTGFNLPVGEVSADDPTGPDEYGYYALDNTDLNITGHPLYSWLEIDPTVPGHIYDGQDVGLTDFGNEQDDTRLLNLPFEFQYYGTVFDQVSICSNGWIAFGDMTYFTDFRNWYLPSSFGPYSMVAPFWDDLYQTTTPARKVYYYYDQTNHRFLVEWNVLNYAPGNPPEIFEVVLFDPLYYTTTSGDGIILFQYQDVANVSSQSTDNHYATVGIKSPDNLIGLQYTYWNDYAPGAANLVDGRAIQFTTQPPLYTSPPVITHTPIPDVTSPTNGYTVSADITGYYQIDEDSVFIFWSTERVGPYNQLILPPAPSATPTDFLGNIPEVEPGNVVYYYLYARDVMGNYTYLPDAAPDEVFSFMVGPQTLVVFDDAETATGWLLGVPGDDATTGIWIRDDPVVSYADNGALVQPEDDHTPDPGHICFVTGNAALGAPGGTNDVDGGQTTLRSPMYDLTGFENILISFWYFYTNDQGLNPSQDYWDVAVSNDSGAIWFSVIHTTGTTNSEWYHYQFWLNDYVSPSNRVLLHFIASDEDGGSLVEACVDDISIINLDTTWGNWAEGEYIPASEIRVEFSDDEIHFSWPPVMDAEVYQLIAGNNPSFDDDQGEIIAEVMNNNVVVKRTSTVGYYRVKVIK